MARHGLKLGCQEAKAKAFSILEAEAFTLFKLEAEALVKMPKPVTLVLDILGKNLAPICTPERRALKTRADMGRSRERGVNQGSKRFPRIKFHDFSMIFHDSFVIFQ